MALVRNSHVSPLAESLDIGDFRCLAAMAASTSLAGAARSLGISTSTISRRLAHLEDALGVTLLQRGRSGTQLTDAGRVAVKYVYRALDDVDTIIHISQKKRRRSKRTAADRGSPSPGRTTIPASPCIVARSFPRSLPYPVRAQRPPDPDGPSGGTSGCGICDRPYRLAGRDHHSHLLRAHLRRSADQPPALRIRRAGVVRSSQRNVPHSGVGWQPFKSRVLCIPSWLWN